jgi:hypothetical protein
VPLVVDDILHYNERAVFRQGIGFGVYFDSAVYTSLQNEMTDIYRAQHRLEKIHLLPQDQSKRFPPRRISVRRILSASLDI